MSTTRNMYRDGKAEPGVLYCLTTGEEVPADERDRGPVCDRYEIDERDANIFGQRRTEVAARTGPQSGDWVYFADGVERRISHVWDWSADADGPAVDSVQTSDGGSWYLGECGASFSGALFPGVKATTLTATGQRRQGACWIFHHNLSGAGRGIEGMIPFQIWACSEAAPR